MSPTKPGASSVAAGARLGHYTLVSLLGAGGMGEVWLAEDATLKRKVALKVLSAAVTADPERLARLQREAEAVAALSHPNIVTLYSIEQDGDVRFLTMEVVEGQSLDKTIPRGGLPLEQVLDIGAALADALGLSHEKGIIHRDVKPANIMLAGRERRVKLLDFGLAKLRERTSSYGETTTAPFSGEGRILGTAAYMSPEQAEAKPVDARSDLFSLGVVLYELATGERPFKGETSLSVLAAIVRDTPTPVSELRADLPRELSRIIRRCLQKEPEQRYQTAKDIRNDLRGLHAEVESGELERSGSSAPPAAAPRSPAPQWVVAAGLLVVAAAALAGLFAARRFSLPDESLRLPFEAIQLKRLTDSGRASCPAVSPDGRYVAYAVSAVSGTSLRLRQIATGSDVEVLPASGRQFVGLAFTPDGSFIYYTVVEPAERTPRTLYRIPVLGGPARRIVDDVFSGPSVSPDGTRLGFIREDVPTSAIIVTHPDGTAARVVTTRQVTDGPFRATAWSPDGRSLAGLFRVRSAEGYATRLAVINVEKGTSDEFDLRDAIPNSVAWLPGGILVAGFPESVMEAPLWLVAYPGGETRRITRDLRSYIEFSATADGKTVVAVESRLVSHLWTVAVEDPRSARQITSGSTAQDGGAGLTWTPDERLIFASNAGGTQSLWSVREDGAERHQITFEAVRDSRPTVSPDGRLLAFASSRTPGIWCANIDGSNMRLLAKTKASEPFFTPDSRSVLYEEDGGVWRVAVGGGKAEPLPRGNGTSAWPKGFSAMSISRDGRWLAGAVKTGDDREPIMVSIDGSQPWRRLKNITTMVAVAWRPDGRAIAFVRPEGDGWNIWLAPLDGSPAHQLTSFVSGRIMNLAWSHDGRRLAFARGEDLADLVMITEEKK
jgi:eukaryotic-like serine/threonine-protein kinase